jgi:hypothetical protein
LISADDPSLYTITDRLDVACEAIANFYRVFHSCRYFGNRLVIRLNSELSDADVEQLNENFSDILVKGRIEKSQPLPQEKQDVADGYSHLVMYFNQRDLGRLYQFIAALNQFGAPTEERTHPERK